jgi:hypothetical protein
MTIGACTSGAALTVGTVLRSRSALCTCRSMSLIFKGNPAKISRMGISMRPKRGRGLRVPPRLWNEAVLLPVLRDS